MTRWIPVVNLHTQSGSSSTVLCESNANVFRRNSRLFLAYRQTNIEFSMEANFQRKVTLIRDVYCFQVRKFSNDNSFGTKIDFEFSSENLRCSINDLDHVSEISLFICSAQAFPRIFWTIICLVWICRDDSFLLSLHSVSFTTNSCLFIQQVYTRLTCITSKVAALTPLFFGGFFANVCRPPLTDTGHVCISQTPCELVFVLP